ncbi:MAG: long-chain fatty acid--CoA ligase [Chlamydiota bacterium]|nr:long-chain fatty acid--CoA ligase [Chlamydiota bacterium]
MEPLNTIGELVHLIDTKYKKQNAFNYQNFEGGWDSISSEEFVRQIKYLALGLQTLGLKKGEMVGLLAASSPRWTIADIAIMIAGGVTVPLFGNISEENFEFEIQQTNLNYIFVTGDEQWEMFSHHKDAFDNVITLYDEKVDHKAFSFSEIVEQGRALDEKDPHRYQSLLDAIKPDDLATIVYTSGSTGVPKGAMLTHQNLISLLHQDPFQWNEDDCYLSVLPLAHIFARSVNFIMITWGIPIYYIRDIKTVGEVCKNLHPTILVVVPRILEKIYAKLSAKVDEAGFLKRAIGHWAFDLAADENDNSLYKKIMHPVADKIVYSAIREALGGKLRVVISGGAPLNPHLYHFFLDIGVPLFEGWGLTEAATVTCNRINDIKIGSVGVPFEGMQVKTSPDGEILVKGGLVMQGYYKNEEETKAAFTEDGWLRTGDKGHVDEQGHVVIEGRLKELFKTSTGEYIAPVPIEQELCKVPLIDMAMVVAEGKKFASVLLFPDFEVLKGLKRAQSKEGLSDEEFLNGEFIKNEMNKLFEGLNLHLNHWEEIHGYKFISTPPTVEGGELTPTMKIRRSFVLRKYGELIDKIYVEEAA